MSASVSTSPPLAEHEDTLMRLVFLECFPTAAPASLTIVLRTMRDWLRACVSVVDDDARFRFDSFEIASPAVNTVAWELDAPVENLVDTAWSRGDLSGSNSDSDSFGNVDG